MATILIVEDEEQVRVLAESYLRDQGGHRTLTAATTEQALAVLGENDVDLLFVDVELDEGGQEGLELAKQAVAVRPGVKALYTTKQDVSDGMRALFVEKSAVLPKPYTVGQLEETLVVKFGIKPLAVA